MWNLKKKTKEYIKLNRKRLIDIENTLVVTNGKMEVGGAGCGGGFEAQATDIMYKINKLQGHIVQHRKYSLYFAITLNGRPSTKILNHCAVYWKLT